MNKTTFDTRIDEAVFDAVVAKGVRENGTVIDLDTLIVDRQKLEDNIRTLVNDVCMEVFSNGRQLLVLSDDTEHWNGSYIETSEARTKLATILEGSE